MSKLSGNLTWRHAGTVARTRSVSVLVATLVCLGALPICGCGGLFAVSRPNVLIVGWDGAQRNHVNEMLAAGELPHLQRLAEDGSKVDTVITRGGTDTRAGWPMLLTGYFPDVTGCRDNWHYAPIPMGLTLLERLEMHFGDDGIYTACIAGKGEYFSADEGEPWQLVSGEFDFFVNDLGPNENVGNVVLDKLAEHRREMFCIFLQFREPDEAGHEYNENSPEYAEQLVDLDRWLGRFREELRRLGISGWTHVFVVTDHGFEEGGWNHMRYPDADCANTFLVANVRGLHDGGRADLAPTVYELLGIDYTRYEPALSGASLLW